LIATLAEQAGDAFGSIDGVVLNPGLRATGLRVGMTSRTRKT
jgi:hypothetical protein